MATCNSCECGFVRTLDTRGRTVYRRCPACFPPLTGRERLRDGGWPTLYLDAELSRADDPARVERIIRATRNGDDVLVLGRPGVGKTWAVAAAVRDFPPARYVSAHDLVADEQRRIGEDDPMGERLSDRAERAELLVLDDLGAERSTDFARDRLVHLLVQRYDWRRQTIVTTNLTPEALGETYGARLASRLSTYTRLVIEGLDKRARRRATGGGA